MIVDRQKPESSVVPVFGQNAARENKYKTGLKGKNQNTPKRFGAPLPSMSGMECALQGCTRPVFVDKVTKQPSPCCGRSHMKEFSRLQQMGRICKLKGCNKQTNPAFEFCSKQHGIAYNQGYRQPPPSHAYGHNNNNYNRQSSNHNINTHGSNYHQPAQYQAPAYGVAKIQKPPPTVPTNGPFLVKHDTHPPGTEKIIRKLVEVEVPKKFMSKVKFFSISNNRPGMIGEKFQQYNDEMKVKRPGNLGFDFIVHPLSKWTCGTKIGGRRPDADHKNNNERMKCPACKMMTWGLSKAEDADYISLRGSTVVDKCAKSEKNYHYALILQVIYGQGLRCKSADKIPKSKDFLPPGMDSAFVSREPCTQEQRKGKPIAVYDQSAVRPRYLCRFTIKPKA